MGRISQRLYKMDEIGKMGEVEEYKDKIPQKLYVVMINYKVEIND